jgi:hypothetical protein
MSPPDIRAFVRNGGKERPLGAELPAYRWGREIFSGIGGSSTLGKKFTQYAEWEYCEIGTELGNFDFSGGPR